MGWKTKEEEEEDWQDWQDEEDEGWLPLSLASSWTAL